MTGYCNCPTDDCSLDSENYNAGGDGQLYRFEDDDDDEGGVCDCSCYSNGYLCYEDGSGDGRCDSGGCAFDGPYCYDGGNGNDDFGCDNSGDEEGGPCCGAATCTTTAYYWDGNSDLSSHGSSKCREYDCDSLDGDCCGYDYETWCADGYTLVRGTETTTAAGRGRRGIAACLRAWARTSCRARDRRERDDGDARARVPRRSRNAVCVE